MTYLFDVLGLDASDTVLRTAALALPVAVLLTLVVLLRVMATSKKKRGKLPKPLTAFGGANGPSAGADSEADKAVPSTPSVPVLAPSAAVAPGLQNALATVPKAAMAPLYLELSRAHRAAGDEAASLSALRSAAGLAAQHGPRSAHAEARLELAEAAYKSGDLTSACEQWQMARTALHEDGQKEAYARVDKRMRDHGCPTDWVLTDF